MSTDHQIRGAMFAALAVDARIGVIAVPWSIGPARPAGHRPDAAERPR